MPATFSGLPAGWRRAAAALGLAALGLTSACQITKPVVTPPVAAAPAVFQPGQTPADSASAADIPWRRFFADETLVGLIDTALRANPDLQIAVQRVEQARANLQVTRGALLPAANAVGAVTVDRFADYSGTGFTDTNDGRRLPTPTADYFLGLRSAWEIDLWGKLRQRRRAAYTRVLASEQGRRLVQTALVAQVAQLYYELLALDNELLVLNKNDTLQARALEIVKVEKIGARATELAVQQFTAQLLRTRSLEVDARQRIVAAENELNRVLGRYPRRIARGRPLREQALPTAVTAGLPARMLLRRPDVQQAELEITAARADVAAARAAFLPSLTLTPYLGLNAYRAALLFSTPGSLVYGALTGLAAPLLNRNALKGDYRRVAAEQQIAFQRYHRTLQVAFQEVATSLQGVGNYRRMYELQQQEVAALNRAVAVSGDLYKANYATYLELITAQRNALDAELALTNIHRVQFQQLIDLYRALGGGWDAAPT